MSALAYKVLVESPCPGEQLVAQQSVTLYMGATGSFTFVTLALNANKGCWEIRVIDYGGLGCGPWRDFAQATPDSDDPEGVYYGLDGSGDPDPAFGEVTVSVMS